MFISLIKPNDYIILLSLITFAPSTLSIALNHAFSGMNYDDSIHVGALTTIPTPQTFATMRWGNLWSIA